MFPLTHIWFCRRLQGSLTNEEVLGSIFPDIVITKCLDYTDTHHCTAVLPQYLKSRGQEAFAKAMMTHTVDPNGLDYFGDEFFKSSIEKGYCFQKAAPIVEGVIQACNIPEDYGLWKAHNFIEMGIEINLVDNNPELPEIMHNALKDPIAIQEASQVLEDYYKLDAGTIKRAFGEFSELIELKEVNSRNLAAKYDLQMYTKHGIHIDIERSAKLIEASRSIVRSDFNEFIDYCIDEVCNKLAGF